MTSKTERGPRLTNQGPRNSNNTTIAKHTPGGYGIRLTIATAATKESKHWRNETVTWDELVGWMAEPASWKECGGYVLGALRDSPGPRTRENLLNRCALSWDADKARPDLLDRVAEVLTDVMGDSVCWLAHPTFNSTPEAPRWRIIVLLAAPVDADTYTALSRALLRQIDPDAVEFDWPASTRPEQFMWKPAVPTGQPFAVHKHDGRPLALADHADAVLAELGAMLAEARAAASAGVSVAVDRDPTADEMEAAEALLAHEVARVRAAEPGQRNETVSSALFRVFRFVKTGCLDEDAAVAALEEAAPFGDGYTKAEFRASLDGARHKAPAEWPKLTVGTAADDFTVVDDRLAAELGLEPEPAADGQPQLNARQRLLLQERRDRAAADHAFALETTADVEPLVLVRGSTPLPPRPPDLIPGLIVAEGMNLLTGQEKTGKTTFSMRTVGHALTGSPFMGRFTPAPHPAPVVFLNYELSARMFQDWQKEMGFADAALIQIPMQGRGPLVGPLLQQVADVVRSEGVKTVVVDPFSKAGRHLDQDKASQVQPWLLDVEDALLGAGAERWLLTAHSPRSAGNRAKGSNALEGHAAGILNLYWHDADKRDYILLRSYGRMDGELTGRLEYQQAERDYAFADAGEVRQAASAARDFGIRASVEALLQGHPDGLKMTEVLKGVPHRDADVRATVQEMADEVLVKVTRRSNRNGGDLVQLLEDNLDDLGDK